MPSSSPVKTPTQATRRSDASSARGRSRPTRNARREAENHRRGTRFPDGSLVVQICDSSMTPAPDADSSTRPDKPTTSRHPPHARARPCRHARPGRSHSPPSARRNACEMLGLARSGRVQSLVTVSRAELACNRCHSWDSGVQRDEHVERFTLAHLADDEPVGPHAEGFFDEAAERDLAGAFEVGEPGLEGDPVGGGQAEFEDFFAGDDAFAAGDGGGEAIEHRGLAGLGAAGDDDVEPGGDGRFEESGGVSAAARRARRVRPRRTAGKTNLRMLIAQCLRVTSGMTTCSREPSGKEASTKGCERSRRRPLVISIRSTRSRTCSSASMVVVSSLTPPRATNTRPGSLIHSSSTVGSSRYCCSGPADSDSSAAPKSLRAARTAGTAMSKPPDPLPSRYVTCEPAARHMWKL